MNRGYAGFYKGHYLRSSYEYAYAKYLDFHLIPWGYEEEVFDLGYKKYKPDFFFYDDEKLIKIVEIKSRDKNVKDQATKALNAIVQKYNISCELISYEELLELYKSLPFSLNSTITEWINSKDTTVNKAAYGELNSHFNFKHSIDTKMKIGNHTKKLWASDSVSKQNMIEGLRKSGLVQKGKYKKPREVRMCKECSKPFEVIISSPKLYCSRNCSGIVAVRTAKFTNMECRSENHKAIKEFIIQWSLKNADLILDTPYNKIKTTLQPLIVDIHKKFRVKDFRVISKSVFGKDQGRKELLKFMKDVCNENVC
ncbi:PDDEXK family nuclease [Litchfieldia alkalitelluris]|uniref:restriction endonuclease n=1 Tax=Litchfieldia alkalitelluris TaxID=304268 RepID=UPI0009978E5D|nr:restriction endonuclease [Litchfieldia alkalitelluris]